MTQGDLQQEVVDQATESLVADARRALEEYPVPYVDYLGYHKDEIDPDVYSFLKKAGDAIEVPCRPNNLKDWLDSAAEALANGGDPPQPHLYNPHVDADGDEWLFCLGCGTTFKADDEKPCGCPVGAEPTHPPDKVSSGST